MLLDHAVLTLYLVAQAERSSSGTSVVAILAAMYALQLGVMLILWRAFGRGGADEDDPGLGGDGPGGRHRRPRKPPPDDPECWPEFERQFAEHVAAAGDAQRRA
jgi:hypothetical protein